MTEKRYCSACCWSTDEPQRFPPRWRCVLHGARIAADDEAGTCKDYVKISVTHE